MQKKIIVLAIASALTVPALAYAEATVYGQANLSIDRATNGVAAPGDATANQLNTRYSRIGVKGAEDLGSGMSVVWQMEGTVSLDVGTTAADGTTNQPTSLFNRNTYLGLKSNDMGTVLLGLHDSPYKIAGRKLDVFADSAADNRTLIGTHDVRLPNVIAYISPSFGGMSVAAATMFGGENQVAAPGNKKGTALSLAGMYNMEGIYAALAYQTIKVGDATTGDLGSDVFGGAVDDQFKAFRLGGGYSMDVFTVNASLEKLTDTVAVGGTQTTGTNLYLAGKFGLSSTDAVKAAYTKRGETTVAGVKQTDNATQIAIGYDHGMSKTTTVYALYTKITNATNGTSGTATAGADPSVWSFGINHSF